MKSYDPHITFCSQIEANAKDYTIAYSQCQNVAYSVKKINKQTVSPAGKKYAEKVRNGYPLTMGDMFSVAEQNGIKIKIVDDPNYQMT